jgi:Ala-tRNA(Pro) deacylase
MLAYQTGTVTLKYVDSRADTYAWLIDLLHHADADYELIDHEPTGTTEVVSQLRGHPLEQAAKCLLLMVKLDRKSRQHVLAVVPGDCSVDLRAIAAIYDARYVGFCDTETAEQLAKAVSGTVLPFAVDPSVNLVVDPAVLTQPRLYFNAARLDRSVSLATTDYARIAQPRTHPIATARPTAHA